MYKKATIPILAEIVILALSDATLLGLNDTLERHMLMKDVTEHSLKAHVEVLNDH